MPPPVSQHPRTVWVGGTWVFYPVRSTLWASGRGRDNPPSRKALCRVSGVLLPRVVRLLLPWGFLRGAGEALKQARSLVAVLTGLSPLGTLFGRVFC